MVMLITMSVSLFSSSLTSSVSSLISDEEDDDHGERQNEGPQGNRSLEEYVGEISESFSSGNSKCNRFVVFLLAWRKL